MTLQACCVQDGTSCLWAASQDGHLEVVKYLYGCGGEALLMLTDEVRWREAEGDCSHVCMLLECWSVYLCMHSM